MKTLVLNFTYEPLHFVGWKHALRRWFQGVFDPLEFHHVAIDSYSGEFLVPSIVKLTKYVDVGKNFIRFTRRNILARDGHRCQYCGRVFPPNELTLDHVLPIRLGGEKTWSNVVASCAECNAFKGGRTPKQANMTLLQTPWIPSYIQPIFKLPLSDTEKLRLVLARGAL